VSELAASAFTTVQSPTAGIYVPVPPLGDVGGPLVIDMKLQTLASLPIQVTCEITSEQVASGDPREGVYYVFAANATDTMAGLPGSYKYDMTDLVPDVIGIGFAAREVAPVGKPYLLLMSRTALDAEVRIRVS
jgi:hypothetical protein